MKRLKSFLGLMMATVIMVFSAQAQEAVSQAKAPTQDAPAAVVAKAVKGEMVTSQVTTNAALTPVSNYVAKSEIKPAAKAAKKALRKVASVNELEGTYVLTGMSLLTSGYNGVSVRVAALGTDSIEFHDFWASGYNTVVKAKVDLATGAITIPAQVMGQHESYGDIVFAKTDLANGNPLMDATVAATVNADGSIAIDDAWGAYVKATPTATTWSYFAVVAQSVLEKCNATFTGKVHGEDTIETYGVVFAQTGDNVATVKNLGNFGQTVAITLNRNNTASIPSSLIAYNSSYGDFYSYNLIFTETGAQLSTDDAVTLPATDDFKLLKWANWGVVTGNAQGSRYLVSAYDECSITTTVDITYPHLSVTEFEGEGTETNPYQIKTRDDLILLSDKVAEITEFDCTTPPVTSTYCRAFLGKYFKVMNDIDMEGYRFTPIGDDWQHIFAGQFDGDNHTISNLNINKKGAYAALFGRTDTTTVIKNLKIDGANVVGQSSHVGAVVGWSLGTIENITVTNSTFTAANYCVGAVAGISYGLSNITVKDCEITSNYGYAGGVAGEVHGPVVNCAVEGVRIVSASASSSAPGMPVGGVVGNLYFTTMSNCHFAGELDGNSMRYEFQTLGGLAGWASASTIENSYAVGTISGYAGGAIAGGLVGFLRGEVRNCHFNGRVDNYSGRATGGAFGRVQAYTIETGDPITESVISNVYTAASVTAETYQYQSQTDKQNNEVIGVIIDGSNPVINNLYFDKQMVNITKSQYGVNTAELVSATGPAGFDANVWQFTDGRYPVLKANANDEAAKLASSTIILPEGASMDKFTKNAAYHSNSMVGFYKQGTLNSEGYYAKFENGQIVLNNENKFGNDTIFFHSIPIGTSYYRIAKIAPIPYEGAGTEEMPYLLKTKNDLILLSQFTTVNKQLFPDTYFKVANDIDLEYDEAFLGICTDASDAANYFAGTIDGDGHFIHKMKFNSVVWSSQPENGWGTINTSASFGYKGFVGRLSGTVKNLNIADDCDLHFYASSGAVVGYNNGIIDNCRNYADVMGNSCWIGGITGQSLKDGKVLNCFNAGNVVGGYGQTGGIAGSSVSLMENCMNVGRVELRQLATNYATQLQSAGGITGTSSSGAKYVNCVNAGTVSAQIKRAGGITGYWGAVSPTSTGTYYRNDMINCVNYGTVLTADQSTIGAIAGGEAQSTSEEIYGVYWDAQILDIPADANAAHEGMNGVETSVLTSGTALEGFDTNIWQFEAGKYPVLKQFAADPMVQTAAACQILMPTGVTAKNLQADATITSGVAMLADGTKFTLEGLTLKGLPTTEDVVNDTLTVVDGKFVKIVPIMALPVIPLQGDGTAENPYLITNAAQWNALASFMSKTSNDLTGKFVAVTADLDFTNEPDGIIPLGADGVTAFNATLNGNNHTLSGYNFVSSLAGQGALFGTIGAEGLVKDIVAAGSAAGGLGGAKGTTKLGYVGGVVGKLYGILNNVTNRGNVTGIATHNAGIAAYVYQGAALTGCKNYGTVASSAAYVGGIAAYVYENSMFVNCENHGSLSSTVAAGNVGGIAAYALPSVFDKCVNYGTISGGSSAGIVANCYGKTGGLQYIFNECVNNGEISGNASLGGITALQNSTAGNNVCLYTNCVNNGDITATATSAVSSSSMAGIAAFYSPGSVFDGCENYGYITNTKSVYTAGITGYYKGSANATYPVVVKNCKNYGNITSQAQQIAGIIAYVSNYVSIDSCYNEGNIEQGMWGAAGICYTFTGANSSLTNCINAGDVTVAQYYAGGIVGNNANASSIINGCINIGNIATTSTATTNNYGVGGIAGGAYANVTNCFNAGNVTGRARVGGIVGSPSYYASTPRTKLTNCVNIGSVTADEGCGGPLVGTLASDPSKYWGDNNECVNSYYLNDVSFRGAEHGIGDNLIIGTGKSVAELVGMNLNEAGTDGEGNQAPATNDWIVADEYSFPVPAIAGDNSVVRAHAAAVVLTEGDTYDNVTNPNFFVGSPEETQWNSNNPIVVFEGNNGSVTEISDVEVTLTSSALDYPDRGVEWKLKLNVTSLTGIDDNTIGKVVAQEAYYNVAGVKVEKPATSDGQVYIVVRKYTDGTMNAVKVRN